MKGDLHTLKRVCEYASKVMFAAEIVIAGLIAVTLVLGIASLFSESVEEMLSDWLMIDSTDRDVHMIASFFETLGVWVMGFVTVKAIHDIMCSIRDEHSPFTEKNTSRMKALCFVYLGAAFVFLIIELLVGRPVAQAFIIFLGCLLIAVVMYCLTLMCRYGGVLQKESDETL